MKKITCELCGSNDIIKDDGLFVCQSCGTKYSLEEARKLMIEGTVEVTGTVQVDTSKQIKEQVDRLVQLAKDAINNNDFDSATGYVDKALDLTLDNSEIWMLRLNCIFKENPYNAELDVRKIIEAENNILKYTQENEKDQIKYKIYDLEFSRIAKRIDVLNDIIGGDVMLGFIRDYYDTCVRSGSMNPGFETRNGLNLQNDESECYDVLYSCKTILFRIIEEAFPSCYQLIGKAEECVTLVSKYKNCLVRRANACGFGFSSEGEAAWNETICDLNNALKQAKQRIDKEKERLAEEERQKIEAYWEDHPEEKKVLEEEKNKYQEELEIIEKRETEIKESLLELEEIKGNLREKDDQIVIQIQELNKKQQQLGVFKVKEKKQIQQEIDRFQCERPSRDEMDAEVACIKAERAPQIDALRKEQKEIRDKKKEIKKELLRVESALALKEEDDVNDYELDDAGWIICEEIGFVRCPKCGKRYAVDFIKYRSKCSECGCERKEE